MDDQKQQNIGVADAYVIHLHQEINRLNTIIKLLAGEVDINNEVWDALSAEYDYDVISSWAKNYEE